MNLPIRSRLRIGIFSLLLIFIIFQLFLVKSVIDTESQVKKAVITPNTVFRLSSRLDQALVNIFHHFNEIMNSNDIPFIKNIIAKNIHLEERFYRDCTLLYKANVFPGLKNDIENLIKEYSKFRHITGEFYNIALNRLESGIQKKKLYNRIRNITTHLDDLLSEIQEMIIEISEKSISTVNISVNRLYFFLFITFLVFLIITLFLPFYFSKLYLKRLNSLNKFASEFAAGNYSERVPVFGTDEFYEVSENLNKMADMLQDQVKRIEKKVRIRTREIENSNLKINNLKIELEKKVHERTNELNEKIRKLNRSKKAMILMIEDLNRVTSELKNAEKELILKERLATVGQISGNISHELRNPLGVIDSSVFYLKTRLGGKDEKVTVHLERIKANIDASVKIIESLINITRMKKPVFGIVMLLPLIEEVLKDVKIKKGVNVNKNKLSDDLAIIADREQMKMVLRNILQNASDELGEKGKIEIEAKKSDGKYAEILIKDNGRGISKEDLDKIFEPLFTTKARGIGFGLSITKLIIENHNGKIEVNSEMGKGTVFSVFIPLVNENRNNQVLKKGI